MQDSDGSMLQFKGGVGLGIVSGTSDHVRVVIEGAIGSEDVREQAVGPSSHRPVGRAGGELLQQLRKAERLAKDWSRRASRAVRHGAAALPTLAQLIYSPDEEVLKDA